MSLESHQLEVRDDKGIAVEEGGLRGRSRTAGVWRGRPGGCDQRHERTC